MERLNDEHEKSAQVLEFTGSTIIPDEPCITLEKAKAWGLSRVVICGWTEAGEFVLGGSHSEIGENVVLMHLAINQLIKASTDAP